MTNPHHKYTVQDFIELSKDKTVKLVLIDEMQQERYEEVGKDFFHKKTANPYFMGVVQTDQYLRLQVIDSEEDNYDDVYDVFVIENIN